MSAAARETVRVQTTTQRCGRLVTPKMLALINRLLDWFRSVFWKEEMELTLVGLQYSGKTTFVNVIAVRLRDESVWAPGADVTPCRGGFK